MNLSLRARLTLWYSLMLLAVLLAAGVAVVWLHSRLGLSRIDSALDDRAATVLATLRDEFEELALPDDRDAASPAGLAAEALEDLELPGAGVAVLTRDGRRLAGRTSGVRDLEAAELARLVPAGPPVTAIDGLRVHHELQRIETEDVRIVVWTSLEAYQEERATLLHALWLGVPLALVVAMLGGWIIGERGLRPLAIMARQAEAITPDRSDGRLAAPARHDELGALARSFNGLLDRLSGALRMQRQFMADASHQLRTPTSIARIAAEVTLSTADRSTDEYREALTVVATQTKRLSAIIERMFTLALADLKARPLQMSHFYLDELVNDCVRAALVLANGRQLQIRADTPADVPFHGDEGLLREMIMNLLENAVRHTPQDGSVELILSASDTDIRLMVSDTGPGVPSVDAARIFERFVRLENGASAGGGGLGLPIARWVAEAHGGNLILDPSTQGCRFVVTLPMNREVSRTSSG